MSIFSTGLGLVRAGAGSISGPQGEVIRRFLLAGEIYAQGIEAGVGNAYDAEGNPNPKFFRNVTRDVAAGVIGALVVEAFIASGAGTAIVAIAGGIIGAPIAVPALAAAVIAAGAAFVLAPTIAATLDAVTDLLARIFANSRRPLDPLVFDLDGGGAELTALAANDNGQGIMRRFAA